MDISKAKIVSFARHCSRKDHQKDTRPKIDILFNNPLPDISKSHLSVLPPEISINLYPQFLVKFPSFFVLGFQEVLEILIDDRLF